ncbi:MAG: fibronectin type III domain-containing protein [Bacteroidales bacterium]|nr:fibronectin type III domain-containing protein [Bacteroidales bacterium]
MQRTLTAMFVALTFLFLLSEPLTAAYLFLKDGTIIKGTVRTQNTRTLTFKNNKGKVKTYNQRKVMRVIYNKLSLNLIFIQLKDGTTMRMYKVAEDQNTYTFRKDIKKPQELKVDKENILFITERNPTGLRGKTSYETVDLTWFPPFDKMEFFNVYVKGPKQKKYHVAMKAGGKSCVLRGLKSNKTYVILIKGVDASKKETSPSNRITITTLNRPPEAPKGLKLKQGKKGKITLSYRASKDPDGKVVKYLIQSTYKGKKKKEGETTGTSLAIKNVKKVYSFKVTAIDDRGGLSVPASVRGNVPDFMRISFTPIVIIPLGKFNTAGNIAAGGMASFMFCNLFKTKLVAGIEVGYSYMFKKDSLDTEGVLLHYMHMVPMSLKIGWQFYVTKTLSLTPALTGGALFIDGAYKVSGFPDTETTTKGFQGIGGISFYFEWDFADHAFCGIQAGYSMIIDGTGVYHLLMCGLTIGGRF